MSAITSRTAADLRRRKTAAAAAPDHSTPRGHTAARPRRSVAEWWHFAVEHLLMLPAGAAIALVWVNTAPESYYRITGPMGFLVTDVAMVLFFGLIMKEVVEATAEGGVLHPWRRAALPLIASVGLTLVPLALFGALVARLDEPRVVEGWPAVFATDIAFGYFVARVIFGRHPAVPFFLLLAICANLLGILALASGGTSPAIDLGLAAVSMTGAVTMAATLRGLRVRSLWPYLIGAGSLSWAALYAGGLEPAFALVPVLPFIPHAARDRGFFVDAPATAHDPLSRFEHWARHPTQVVLLLFGVIAAGVPLRALDWGTLPLPLTTLVGKPLGLVLGVAVARAIGLHLPARMGWRDVIVVGVLASVGFTVALFFATAAVGAGPTLSELKMGALMTAGGAFAALGLAAVLRTGRFAA
jgi:Na+:H+ antiporter, NhaA family